MRRLNCLTLAATLLLASSAWAAETGVNFVMHRVGNFRSEACGVGDFNNDGKLDIVAGPCVYIAPDWKPWKIRELKGKVDEQGKGYHWDFAAMPLDVDGDGKLDVVSVDWFQKCIDWYRNIGPDGLWPRTVIEENGNFECADLVDIDGDGKALEIMAHVKESVWFERIKGADGKCVMAKRVVATKPHDFGGGVGDVNGDGRIDFLRPTAWYEAPADPRKGEWKEHPWAVGNREAGKAEHTAQILVLDVNADGLNDIIASSAHRYGIFWYEQVKQGDQVQWKQHEIDASWTQAHALTLADINGDGTVDLVTGKRFMAHNGSDPGETEPLGVYWYELHRGAKPTWTKHAISYNEGIGAGLSIPVVDLDGDGDLDIVVTGKFGGPVWFENRTK